MKVYISIPITGHDLEQQILTAEAIAKEIANRGHEPVSPFETPPPTRKCLTEKEEYAYYIGADIERLLLCDAICFAKGWKNSRGCRLEHEAARIYGIKRVELRETKRK